MRMKTPRVLVALAAAGWAGLVPLGAAGAADARSAASTYSCVADSSILPADVKVTFSASGLPSTVAAGQPLAIQGTLTIVLPTSISLISQLQLAKQIGVESSTFGLQLTAGGKTTTLTSAEAVGPPQQIGSTTTVKASASFPDFTVPANASGSLVITMPTEADQKATVSGATGEVVFGTALSQDSLLVGSRNLDCSAPKDAEPAVLARLTITPAVGGSGPSTGSGASGAPSAAVVDEVADALGAADPPAADAAPAAEEAPTDAEAPAASTSGDDLATADAVIPGRTVGRGIFLPTWSILLSATLVPGALIAYAAHRRRLLTHLIDADASPKKGLGR